MKDVGNHESIRKSNRIKILKLIRKNNLISRQDLANKTGLTPAAISGIVREMVEAGYVSEIGPGESNGGRRPVQLRFNPEAGYVIGAEVTRDRTTIGITDLNVNPLILTQIQIDMTEPYEGLKSLVRNIKEVVSSSNLPEDKIKSVGLAFPGLLDTRDKVIRRSPNLGNQWRDIPLQEFFRERIHVPFVIEHNSNAAALAEFNLGLSRDVRDLVYVNLGEGFSAGVISDGHILSGSRGYAGEMGHTVIMENGPLCNCGNRGCLESLYAVPALVSKANSELNLCADNDPLKQLWRENGEVTIENILAMSSVDGSYAMKMMKQAGWYIGIGIANIVNFYNPELISLGGVLTEAGPVIFDSLLESVKSHAFPQIVEKTEIYKSKIGRRASFYGASVSAINELFTAQDQGGFFNIEIK